MVDSATSVLNEIMQIPVKGIPQSMLADAHGVAIIPNVIKAGFIAGGRHGRGVVLVRDPQGAWQPPVFITLTGGSIGWQIGVQATDLILVFKTQKSVEGLMNGKFTIGADAAAAAGPVGRRAEAATDGQLKAELLSYSRSRGLFAGVSIDGAVLQVDDMANAVYYGTGPTFGGPQPGEPVPLPPSAVTLMNQVAIYTTGPAVGTPVPIAGVQPGAPTAVAGNAWRAPMSIHAAVPEPARMAGPVTSAQEESIRRQLETASRQLHALLDAPWRGYLALPAEVFQAGASPNLEALRQALARFETVARDPRYQALTVRPEYQATHELLKQLVILKSHQASQALTLPPPPSR